MANVGKRSLPEMTEEIRRKLEEESGGDLAATLKLLPDPDLEEAYRILCRLFDEPIADGEPRGRYMTSLAKIKWEVALERSRRLVYSGPDRSGKKLGAKLASMAAGPIVAPLPPEASPNAAAPMEVDGELPDTPVAASRAASAAGPATLEANPQPAARLTSLQAADLTASQRELAARIKCKLGELSESEFLVEFKRLPNPEVSEWHHLLKLILEELVEESGEGVPDNRGGNLWLEDLMSRRRKAQAALKAYYERSIASSASVPHSQAASRVVAKAIPVAPVDEIAAEKAPTATARKTTAAVKPIVEAISVEANDSAAAARGASVQPGSASSPYRETREEAAEYVTKYSRLRYQCAQRLRQKYFSDNYEAEVRIGDLVVRESCEDPVSNYLTGSEPDWPPSSDFAFRPKKKLNLKTEARRS